MREGIHVQAGGLMADTKRYSRPQVIALVASLRCTGYHMTMHSTAYTCIEWARGVNYEEVMCPRCTLLTDLKERRK